jgi:hypothetical protein
MQIYLTRYHNFNIVGCLNSIVHELYNVDTFLILVYVLSSPVIKCSSFIVLKRVIVIYGISGLFKILPTRGICNLRGLARVGYYLEWVVLNNPRMPYNVLSNIPQFLDNDIIDEILLPMGYER